MTFGGIDEACINDRAVYNEGGTSSHTAAATNVEQKSPRHRALYQRRCSDCSKTNKFGDVERAGGSGAMGKVRTISDVDRGPMVLIGAGSSEILSGVAGIIACPHAR